MNDYDYIETTAYGFIGACGLFICLVAFLVLMIVTFFEKEDQRQESNHYYYCKHYGEAINNHAGEEVCAPTENG